MIKEKIKEEKEWHRKCELIYDYHLFEKAKHSSKRGEGKWKIEDTAKMLGLSVGLVSENIKLAKAMIRNDSLAKMTRENALKFIKES